MSEETKIESGWGWPMNSKKAHYFHNDSRSACNGWLYAGPLEVGNNGSPDNCTRCRKFVEKNIKSSVHEAIEKAKGKP